MLSTTQQTVFSESPLVLEHKRDTPLPDLTMLTTWRTAQSAQQEKLRGYTEAHRPGDHRTSAAPLRIRKSSE